MQRRAQRSVSGCGPAVPAGDDPYELWRTPAWVVAMAQEDLARAWGVLTVCVGLIRGLRPRWRAATPPTCTPALGARPIQHGAHLNLLEPCLVLLAS